MALLLSLDTATRACTVALRQDGELLASSGLWRAQSHSERLTLLVEDCLRQVNATLSQLDAVAVSMGPGSYTGLRIGVATAKGLCYALDKLLIGINTLEAMAHALAQTYPPGYWFCPMLDARRMEVYCAIFDQQLNVIQSTQARVMEPGAFAAELSAQRIVFFGDGAAKCRALLSDQPNAIFLDEVIYPSAVAVGQLAHRAFLAGRFENVAHFEPFYLKDFVSGVCKPPNPSSTA